MVCAKEVCCGDYERTGPHSALGGTVWKGRGVGMDLNTFKTSMRKSEEKRRNSVSDMYLYLHKIP
jgi:hypothetical protein